MWLISTCHVGGTLPFELRPGEFTMGREQGCHIELQDSSVSRQHAKLRVSPAGDIHVVDLGSRTGTYLNEGRVKEVRVTVRDRLRLGAVPLEIAAKPMPSLMGNESTRVAEGNPSHSHSALTLVQQQVFQLLLEGLSSLDIAQRLGRSYWTVRNYIKVIFRVYGVHSRSQLMARADRRKKERQRRR